jgi:hypothetical protein
MRVPVQRRSGWGNLVPYLSQVFVQQVDPLLRAALERMDPTDAAVVFDRCGAVMYGAATRMCGTPREAEALLERTFILLGNGKVRYTATDGSPLLWLLARMREVASVHSPPKTVDGTMQACSSVDLRCFGLDVAPVDNSLADAGPDTSDEHRNARLLAFREALHRA